MTSARSNKSYDAVPHWRGLFEKQAATKTEPAWLCAQRQQGMARLADTGFPTTRHEDWKYTDVAPLLGLPYALGTAPSAQLPATSLLDDWQAAPLLLLFLGGRFVPERSRLPATAKVSVMPMSEAVLRAPQLLERHLQQRDGAFGALNDALWTDGAFVHVERGTALPGVLHLAFVGGPAEHTSQLRSVWVLDDGAQAQVVEHYLGEAAATYFTNAQVGVSLAAGARLEHVKVQEEGTAAFHISALSVQQARDSYLSTHLISRGSRLARTDVHTVLAGQGAECVLNGIYTGQDGQLLDSYTTIEHRVSHCQSRELYKGVLDGTSRGVWTGKILVDKGAQKTVAKQSNKNLLLADGAHADSRPQLEIYADDVKCNHGAAIGRIDEDALFYLRSRGIGEADARRLLTFAFASEVVQTLPVEAVRSAVERVLAVGLLGSSEVAA